MRSEANVLLELSPLIAQRKCEHCGKRDIFFFDSLDRQQRCYLLDHLAGHRMSSVAQSVDGLLPLIDGIDFADLGDERRVHEDGIASEFDQWMKAALEEHRYLPPTYLFKPVADYIVGRNKGLVLLSAPAMVGKSVFAAHLEDWLSKTASDNTNYSRWIVKSFSARRGAYGSLDHFETFLNEEVLKPSRDQGGIGFMPTSNPLPIRNLVDTWREENNSAIWTTAFAQRLREMLAYRGREAAAMVIVIDGLDELPPDAADNGLGACLNHPDLLSLLPDDCFLVLTARPSPDCAGMQAVVAQLEAQIQDKGGLQLQVSPNRILDPGLAADPLSSAYRELLQDLYIKRLGERVRIETRRLGRSLAPRLASGELHDDFLDTVEPCFPKEWRNNQQLVAAWGDARGKAVAQISQPAELVSQQCNALQAYLPQALFPTLLDRAQGRFGYLEHIVRLLEEGVVPAEQVSALPQGAQLYRHYLQQLQAVLEPVAIRAQRPRSAWQDILRLLAALAAEQAAFDAE